MAKTRRAQAQAERKAVLKEAKIVERQIGWSPGSLSNPDGWPNLTLPPTKKEIAAREKEHQQNMAAMRAATIAEEREEALDFAEALADYLNGCASVDVGEEMMEALDLAGFNVHKRHEYDD